MKHPGPTPPPSEFVDDSGVQETFADALEVLFVDGETLRLEFVVERMKRDPTSDKASAFTRHPVVRLVLPISAASNLSRRLSGVVQALEEARERAGARNPKPREKH
jgi:hypothetical protein